jgi:hypothetical protein
MSALDSVFNDKQGRELLFSAGVEVGRVRGREEFAQMLIREFPKQERGRDLSFPEFVRIVLVKIQRGDV